LLCRVAQLILFTISAVLLFSGSMKAQDNPMFLTLVIVPLVYYLLDRLVMRLGKSRRKAELLLEE
jgi:hypothetical protein